MKKIILLLICFSFISKIDAQIIINELNVSGNWVELYNAGTTTIDITNYALCNRPRYRKVSETTASGANAGVQLISGSFVMAPGDYIVLEWPNITFHGTTGGELGLYQVLGSYNSTTNIQDFIQWGTGPNSSGRVATAVSAGVWDNANNYVALPINANNSMGLINGPYMGGDETDSTHWEEQITTQGAENTSCILDDYIVGTISSGTYQVIDTLSSNGIVPMSEVVIFKAGNFIQLDGGFTVESSAEFQAIIEVCN